VCQAKKLGETLTLKVGEKLSLEDLRLDLEGVSALDSDPELQYIIPFNNTFRGMPSIGFTPLPWTT